MRKIFLILSLLLIMFCHNIKYIHNEIIIQKNTHEKLKDSCYQLANNIITTPPTIKTIIDWEMYFIPIIQNMLSTKIISNGCILFINTIQNNSHYSFKTDQATNMLINILSEYNKKKFKLINQYIPHTIYENTIHPHNNNLLSYIKLAKKFSAEYILCSNINTVHNEKNKLNLEIQLISIEHKEIIWSDIIHISLTQNQIKKLYNYN